MRESESVRKAVLRELFRRRRCQESLHSFAVNIDVPMSPNPAPRPDETMIDAKTLLPTHIVKLLEVLQRTVTRPFGRAIIQMPPGTAKSTYAGPVTLGWCMGNDTTGIYWKKRLGRYMIVSYGDDLARLQSRRTQSVIEQPAYSELWPSPITIGNHKAEDDWDTNTGDELRSFGILGGITGNRCNGVLIDDPVKNREQADSPQVQKKVVDEYQGSVLSRLLPGAWVILIMTRWNERDLAGYILPDDYKGQSGMVKCKDNLMWEVLNLPAKAENADDPIGRKPGQYIFPEYYPQEHWQMFENASGSEAGRDWCSLYQQRPTTKGIGKFKREMVTPHEWDSNDPPPVALSLIAAGDYAVTEGGGDWTELAIAGTDSNGRLWILDWWSDQTDDASSQMLEMIEQWKVRKWFNEGGNIDKAMRPGFIRRQRELLSPGKHFCPNEDGIMTICDKRHDVWCDLESLASMKDKIAKVSNFITRCSLGLVRFPKHAPWKEKVYSQLEQLPNGRYDDCVDVCGLFGRGLLSSHPAQVPVVEQRPIIRPFTEQWLMMTEFPDKPPVRIR